MQIDSTTWRSPNHSARTERIRALVLHSCEGALPSPRKTSLPWLCNPASEVSTHYYVCRDGTIFQLVSDDQVAWHAGLSFFGGLRNWNDFSLGVELEHRQNQDYPYVQRAALQALCRDLISRYNIPRGLIVAHRWIAVDKFGKRGRRSDPTDWPDDQLNSWIVSLVMDSVWDQWGSQFPLPPEQRAWGIPMLWRDNAAWLGEARTGELYLAGGVVSIRLFQGGLITWEKGTGRCVLTRLATRLP